MTLISIYSSFYSTWWVLSYALSMSSIRCLNLKKFSDPKKFIKVSGGNNQKIYLVLVVVGNRLTHHSKALIELILMIYKTFWYDVPFTNNAEVWGRSDKMIYQKIIWSSFDVGLSYWSGWYCIWISVQRRVEWRFDLIPAMMDLVWSDMRRIGHQTVIWRFLEIGTSYQFDL